MIDKDGTVIDEWTSVKGKPHVIKRLAVGETYILHEEFAPYGYLKATDVTFTLKEMSEILGKETIDSFNTSENRGREVSHGLNLSLIHISWSTGTTGILWV